MATFFNGYSRQDGQAGIRNYVVCIPTVCHSNALARRAAQLTPGLIPLCHIEGTADAEKSPYYYRTLFNLCMNPNIYAAVLIGIGDDDVIDAHALAEKLNDNGKKAFAVNLIEVGGSKEVLRLVVEAAAEFLDEAKDQKREPISISKLVLGTECGGSDALSGITANPAIGYVSDWVVSEGGTSLLTETRELIGCETILANRAITPELSKRVFDAILGEEQTLHRVLGRGSTGVAAGNIKGGISNAREKSLGCVRKGGDSPVSGLIGNGQTTKGLNGLIVLDATNFDPESLTALFSAGAQVVLFSSGCGSPLGFPCGPVIKICSNTDSYLAIGGEDGDADINAGAIITEDLSLAELGERCKEKLLAVLNGEEPIAERRGYGGELCIARMDLKARQDILQQ